jgi:hypothetical protein
MVGCEYSDEAQGWEKRCSGRQPCGEAGLLHSCVVH